MIIGQLLRTWSDEADGRTVNSNIDDIGACRCSSDHRRRGDAGSIMRVYVDGQVGVLLADFSDEPAGRNR